MKWTAQQSNGVKTDCPCAQIVRPLCISFSRGHALNGINHSKLLPLMAMLRCLHLSRQTFAIFFLLLVRICEHSDIYRNNKLALEVAKYVERILLNQIGYVSYHKNPITLVWLPHRKRHMIWRYFEATFEFHCHVCGAQHFMWIFNLKPHSHPHSHLRSNLHQYSFCNNLILAKKTEPQI